MENENNSPEPAGRLGKVKEHDERNEKNVQMVNYWTFAGGMCISCTCGSGE